MSESDEEWLAGLTPLSTEEVATRLARTCEIIREESPEHAAAVLAEMVVLWSSPAGQQRKEAP